MKYKILDHRLDGISPSTRGSAGIDLRACIDKPITLKSSVQAVMSSGISIELPENTVGLIMPRSGLGAKGLILGNTVGVIDSDYRGEIKLCVVNRNDDYERPIVIEPLMRVAQLVVVPCVSPLTWKQEESLTITARGSKGFGSTGNG